MTTCRTCAREATTDWQGARYCEDCAADMMIMAPRIAARHRCNGLPLCEAVVHDETCLSTSRVLVHQALVRVAQRHGWQIVPIESLAVVCDLCAGSHPTTACVHFERLDSETPERRRHPKTMSS